jgi:hypothetical protein
MKVLSVHNLIAFGLGVAFVQFGVMGYLLGKAKSLTS